MTTWLEQNGLRIEQIECCICGGTGKVRHWLIFRSDCPVCEGNGKRPILVPVDPDQASHILAWLGVIPMPFGIPSNSMGMARSLFGP